MTFKKRLCTYIVISCLSIGMWIPLAQGQQVADSSMDPRQKLFLSLEEAINLALQNNLEIGVEQYNPEIKREDIIIFGNAGTNNAEAEPQERKEHGD